MKKLYVNEEIGPAIFELIKDARSLSVYFTADNSSFLLNLMDFI